MNLFFLRRPIVDLLLPKYALTELIKTGETRVLICQSGTDLEFFDGVHGLREAGGCKHRYHEYENGRV